jgi:hypothetical protein
MIGKSEYNRYYSDDTVLYEIVKGLKARETTLIGWDKDKKNEFVVRCIKAHNISYLKNNFKAFDFYNRFFNIYHSVAYLKDMPMFSYNWVKRKEQQRDFNLEFPNYAYGWDFVMDFDGDDVTYDKLWEDVETVKHLFDKYGVPYTLKASSHKGFHIEINDKYFVGSMDDKIKFNLNLVRNIKDLWQVETLDLNIYDMRRVFKVAYSIDIKSGLVVLPLTDSQFLQIKDDFEFLRPHKWFGRPSFMRGLLERKADMDKFATLLRKLEEEELIKNLRLKQVVKASN